MIFIVTKNRVRRRYADDWVSLVGDFTTATRAEPGNLFFDWYRSVDDPTVYVLVEAFRDRAAGEAHVKLGPLQGGDRGALRCARGRAGDRERRGGRRVVTRDGGTRRQLTDTSLSSMDSVGTTCPLDAVTAEVIRSRTETVCFEMATFVSRTATTPILNQSNERNATILDSRGRLPRSRWGSRSSCSRRRCR